MTTRYPEAANSFAVAAPKPADPAVMRATGVVDMMMLRVGGVAGVK